MLSAAYADDPIQKRSATVFSFTFVGDGDSAGAGFVGAAATTNPQAVQQHADDLYTLINDGMAGSKYLSVVKFEPRLVAVQRAVKEQKFTEKEINARIDTTPSGAVKAQKLGSLIGAEIALIGSVDKYIYRRDKGEVELTATIQMVNVSTGKVIEMFTATGRGAKVGDKADIDEIAIGTSANYDAAEKLLTDIMKVNPDQRIAADDGSGTAQQTAGASKPAKKSKSLIPSMVGAVLLGLLIGGA